MLICVITLLFKPLVHFTPILSFLPSSLPVSFCLSAVPKCVMRNWTQPQPGSGFRMENIKNILWNQKQVFRFSKAQTKHWDTLIQRIISNPLGWTLIHWYQITLVYCGFQPSQYIASFPAAHSQNIQSFIFKFRPIISFISFLVTE